MTLKHLRRTLLANRLAGLGAVPARASTPAQFQALVAADSARWGGLIRARKITLE